MERGGTNAKMRRECLLQISDALRAEILATRAALGLRGRTELAIERVEYHETRLGATLSDAVLAVYLGLEWELETIGRLTAEAQKLGGLPSRYLAIAADRSAGTDAKEGEEETSTYWCIPRRASSHSGPVLRYSRARGIHGPHSFIGLLRSFRQREAHLSPNTIARSSMAHASIGTWGSRYAERFEPRLYGESQRTRRRIYHRQYGYGSVRRVIDGPRRALEIEFDESGIRRVLEEYIEPI